MTSVLAHLIDFWAPPDSVHYTHTKTLTISLDHQQTSHNQPSAFSGVSILPKPQPLTSSRIILRGRTGLWNTIKKLTSSLRFGSDFNFPPGLVDFRCWKQWGEVVVKNRLVSGYHGKPLSGLGNKLKSLGTFPEWIQNPSKLKNAKCCL